MLHHNIGPMQNEARKQHMKVKLSKVSVFQRQESNHAFFLNVDLIFAGLCIESFGNIALKQQSRKSCTTH